MTMLRRPLVAIVGSTGTGKSRLAIDLARRFDGEIINGDAMQFYRGLDIATCKVTSSEMDGVPHHMLSFLDAHRQYIVKEFIRDATARIEEIHARGRLPIVVGGTHYYVQSLVFANTLVGERECCASAAMASTSGDAGQVQEDLDVLSPAELYARLQQVDPPMAVKWHPNDTRKIRRSLQIFYETGRRQSDIILEQEQTTREPRFPTLLFWMHTESEVLNQRLDRRVDKMMKDGLLEELARFREASPEIMNFEFGPYQTIGFKEFEDFLRPLPPTDGSASNSDSSSSRASANSPRTRRRAQAMENLKQKQLEQALDLMKRATRQYARRQLTWIQRKLVPLCNVVEDKRSMLSNKEALSLKPPICKLDTTAYDNADDSWWSTVLLSEATDRTEEFLRRLDENPSKTLPTASVAQETGTASPATPSLTAWQKHHCDICQITTNGPHEWQAHLSSRAHRNELRARRSPNWPFILAARERRRRGDEE